MECLGIPHIPYTLIWNDGRPYSVCEDFVSPNTELVSAWRIMRTMRKDNSTSVYQHFINCCQALGVGDIVPALDRMIVLDYLIANEDRHLNNFGLLRNPETLEWLGMAPIFDSGSSLGYDRTAPRIGVERDIVCKPFKKHHAEQLKLVSSFDWVDPDALADIGTLIWGALTDDRARELVGGDRIEAIASAAEKRTHILRELAMAQQPSGLVSDAEGDVEEDIAADYTPKMTM